jgi:hypothetical protein
MYKDFVRILQTDYYMEDHHLMEKVLFIFIFCLKATVKKAFLFHDRDCFRMSGKCRDRSFEPRDPCVPKAFYSVLECPFNFIAF